jgi:3-phosphoinositide dependent protein kinase-1
LTELSDEERAEKLKQQSLTNEYHRFVEGHLILKQGILDKKKGLFNRRRMFLLTEGPHLYYVDSSGMVLKGEIPWSSVLKTEIRDFRIFFVHVPGRIYYLIDQESTSKDWCAAIDEVKQYYFGNDADQIADGGVSSTT